MESGKLFVSRDNPRNMLIPNAGGVSAMKAIPGEVTLKQQQQSTPIADRFRVLLKRRCNEARFSSQDDVLPSPTTRDIVQLYELVLNELTLNSKPIITDLTIIAGEQREHGEGIADAICSRIIEAPIDHKLPSLYLLDSIVKNIGREYVRHFSSRLPEVFCEAYCQVHPSLYNSMRHLFSTWSTVFPPLVLRRIETQLQFSSSADNQSSALTPSRLSESPRPAHGIHVNPKYIRQLDPSTSDTSIPHARGSGLKMYNQKPARRYEDCDFDHAENTTTQMESQRLKSARSLGDTSFIPGPKKPHTSSINQAEATLSSEVDDHSIDESLRNCTGETNEWRRRHSTDEDRYRGGASIRHNLSNAQDRKELRALIDAYGTEKVEPFDINDMDNKASSRPWQSTDEEEFDWEDMSPTLREQDRKSDFLPSNGASLGNGGSRYALRKSVPTTLDSNINNDQFGQVRQQLLHGSSIASEDATSTMSPSHVLSSRITRFPSEPNQVTGSQFSQDCWNFPSEFSQSSHHLNAKGKVADADEQIVGLSVTAGIRSPHHDSLPFGNQSVVSSSSSGAWPSYNVHNSRAPRFHHIPPIQNQIKTHLDGNAGTSTMNQGLNNSSFTHEQHFNSFARQNQVQATHLQPQFIASHEARENFRPSATQSLPAHFIAPHLSRGYNTQGIQLPFRPQSVISGSFYPQFRGVPPLPLGPPTPSQIMTNTQLAGSVFPHQPPGHAYSGLVTSLMAQGLMPLTGQYALLDSVVGLEFNIELLKLRYESSINALYSNLPRQCTTCGLRFKLQEEHSSHMDWHVTKNRMSKTRKQKPSRKWFVSTSMWLSGAEALGSEAVAGFFPTETTEEVVEKKDEEDLAVPADEDQNSCALCGEQFEEFYSDETEEWMYRGAIYLNAPNGSVCGVDGFDSGPIVHAKCRSDSSGDSRRDDGGIIEDGGQRKRIRS